MAHTVRVSTARAWVVSVACAAVVSTAGGQAQGQSTAELSSGPAPLLPARGRVEAASGVSFYSNHQQGSGTSVDATGITATQGRLFGAWFPAGWHLGLAAGASIERFTLAQPATAPDAAGRLTLLDIEAAPALAGQLVSGSGRLVMEGRLGYGWHQIPAMTAAPDGSTTSAPSRGHGPVATVVVGALLSGELSVEGTASVLPVTFGGKFADEAVSSRRFQVGARLVVGQWASGSLHWSGLLGYDFGQTSASATGFDYDRHRHRISIGLRASFAGTPPSVETASDSADRFEPGRLLGERTRARRPAEAPGRILGVVRGGGFGTPSVGDLPIPDIVIEAHATPLARTAEDGSFVLDQVGPGPIFLRLIGDGWKPLEEVITVQPGKDVAVVLIMQKSTAVAPATITGLVSGEGGKPIPAQVSIPELNLKLVAGADGSFLIRVPAGTYTVSIEAPGFDGQRKSVTVTSGEQSIFNVDLHKAAQ